VLTPQRTLALPYRKLLEQAAGQKTSTVHFATMNSIARRTVALFWPLFSEQADFHFPYRPPQFLTLETAQFYLGKIIDSMLDRGAFSSVSIPRHRLYSQVLDNLNKSAVVGFPYTEIGAKLSAAWVGESSQLNVYADLQVAVMPSAASVWKITCWIFRSRCSFSRVCVAGSTLPALSHQPVCAFDIR
jgi:hypothetical protein